MFDRRYSRCVESKPLRQNPYSYTKQLMGGMRGAAMECENVMVIEAPVRTQSSDGPQDNPETQLHTLQQYVCELLMRNQQLRMALQNALFGRQAAPGKSGELEA